MKCMVYKHDRMRCMGDDTDSQWLRVAAPTYPIDPSGARPHCDVKGVNAALVRNLGAIFARHLATSERSRQDT